MSIKQKLLSGFGALLFIIAALGIYVYNGVNTFDEISDKKAASFEQLVDVEMIKNINTSMTLEAMDLIVDKNSGVVSNDYTTKVTELFTTIFEYEQELKAAIRLAYTLKKLEVENYLDMLTLVPVRKWEYLKKSMSINRYIHLCNMLFYIQDQAKNPP